MPTKYAQPNKLDPLSETAINRRIWAAYLRAGFSRETFATAMGVKYGHVSKWDHGQIAISLPHFIQAARLVGYSLDQLAHGHAARALPRQPESALSADGVRALLHEIRATSEQITALAEHRESAAGQLQPFTRTYVTSFVSAYAANAASKSHAVAIKLAMVEAVGAREAVAAIDAGRTPINVAGLEARGRKRGAHKARKRMVRVVVAPPVELE